MENEIEKELFKGLFVDVDGTVYNISDLLHRDFDLIIKFHNKNYESIEITQKGVLLFKRNIRAYIIKQISKVTNKRYERYRRNNPNINLLSISKMKLSYLLGEMQQLRINQQYDNARLDRKLMKAHESIDSIQKKLDELQNLLDGNTK